MIIFVGNLKQINMKKIALYSIIAFSIALTALNCKDKAKEADTSDAMPVNEVEATDTYIVDVTSSQIEWKGFKPTGTHNGTISIEKGEINATDKAITGGKIVVNMTSINSLDLEGEGKQKLESHLKGTIEGKEGDFFNVNQYPDATFEITKSETMDNGTMNLSGNLTVKGVKNNITFPVNVTKDENTIVLKSDAFTIDRTKWGVNFGSKSVFDNLGDSFINDDIELKITVSAKKA